MSTGVRLKATPVHDPRNCSFRLPSHIQEKVLYQTDIYHASLFMCLNQNQALDDKIVALEQKLMTEKKTQRG